jgi:glycosyltransferase involved in cell wall biosynthesis
VQQAAAGRPTIAYVGRLIDGKGVGDLMNALAALEDPGFFCCVVGDGPRRQQLEAQAARLGLAERVVFMGYVGENDVIAILKAADVVVNPSYTEGLPSSVLYAALCGRAVVATDVGGTPEIVEDGTSALLVAPRDVAALSGALARTLADPALRARLGRAAFASASLRFSWDPAVDRFLELAGLSRAPDRAHRAPAPRGAARGSEDAGRPS